MTSSMLRSDHRVLRRYTCALSPTFFFSFRMLRGQIDMPRKPALVCQSTVTKFLKGALKAGAKVSRVEVRPDGSFTIFSEDGALAPLLPDAEIARKAKA
jgi:hypothetical protein